MILQQIFYNCVRHCKRNYGNKIKLRVEGDTNTFTSIENELYKPKHHPGIINPKTGSLPSHIVKAISCVTQDYPIKRIVMESDALSRHLKGRVSLMQADELNETKQKIVERVLMKEKPVEINSDSEEIRFKQKIKDKVEKLLKQKIYNWSPINYNAYNSLLYLYARSAPEFAVLAKIFAEINARDKNYKPRSLFDFGSGVGSVTWAAKLYWNDCLFEYFNVDISAEMNDLAQTILQGGHNNLSSIKGVFYRQFLPANNTSYDLVVSAYSMLELPSSETRLETILNLWNKTNKYLVVVEQGTNAGFKVINEIRDFILHLQDEKNIVHVFSPCPHESPCPRFLNDNTPCNFEIRYTKPFGKGTEAAKELYSYVVLKKGERNAVDDEWPRVVRETLVRSKHTICRMCTSDGSLKEVIFTASKHGKSLYHCARATKWGDRLPITIKTPTETF